jgi:hypothetical protein
MCIYTRRGRRGENTEPFVVVLYVYCGRHGTPPPSVCLFQCPFFASLASSHALCPPLLPRSSYPLPPTVTLPTVTPGYSFSDLFRFVNNTSPKTQILLVYGFAAVAKVGSDWLHGYPALLWTTEAFDMAAKEIYGSAYNKHSHTNVHQQRQQPGVAGAGGVIELRVLGHWVPRAAAFAISWGGLAFDMAIGPLLCSRRTSLRRGALVVVRGKMTACRVVSGRNSSVFQ